MFATWDNVPYMEHSMQSLEHDYRVHVPGDLIRRSASSAAVGAKRVARKSKKKTLPIPMTRRVKVSPMLSEDSDWYIYPNNEFFDVCENETVLSRGGAGRVFWHYYRKKYPQRTREQCHQHDVHKDTARRIKNMYLTHKKGIGRSNYITFSTDTGKKIYIKEDALKKHLMRVRKERKNKYKLRILKYHYPDVYSGITLQNFTAKLWRLRVKRNKKRRIVYTTVHRNYRVSEKDECVSFLRTTKLRDLFDWLSSEVEKDKSRHRCAKKMWHRFHAHLHSEKIDTSTWPFRRFVYCVRRICSSDSLSSDVEDCPGETCDEHHCHFSVALPKSSRVWV